MDLTKCRGGDVSKAAALLGSLKGTPRERSAAASILVSHRHLMH